MKKINIKRMNVEPELQVSQIVGEATISRKPDFLLGVELAAFLKGDTGAKADELAYTLLEQSFQVGCPQFFGSFILKI